MSEIGQYIRKARKDSNRTMEEIKSYMGYSKSYQINIELGRSGIPPLETVIRLCDYLKADIHKALLIIKKQSKGFATVKFNYFALNNAEQDQVLTMVRKNALGYKIKKQKTPHFYGLIVKG